MGDRVSAINFFNQAAAIPKPTIYTGNPQLQYQLFSSAVIADPKMGQAQYELGNANRDMGLLPAAIASYRAMTDLEISDEPGGMTKDMLARALTNMGHCLYTLGQYEEGELRTRLALDIDDKLSLAWCNLSLIQSATDKLDASLHSAQRAFDLDPTNAVIETGLAFAYLYKQDFATGLRHFEARFPYRLQHFLNYPYPKWTGEEGKTVYLVSEQGLGDALSFSRFIEMAAKKCAFMHIIVQREMVRLLRVALQHVGNINIIASPAHFLPADYWSTFMSLPVALGLSTEEIINQPNIRIPQFMFNLGGWKNPDAKLHIGVAWSGSPASDINHWRSFPVTQLLDLYKCPGIQLYSIQANDQVKDLHSSGCGVMIRDLSPHLTDVCETIAMMDHLDLIVTTESAPGHIAGHANIDCIIPYSRNGTDWRASRDGQSPIWYPKHKFVRQGKDATWPGVFDRIVQMLKERVDG